MSISNEQLEQLHKLAKLDMNDAAKEKLAHQFNSILELVDQLSNADIEDVAPLYNPLDQLQRLRPDEVTEKDARETLQTLSEHVSDSHYVVPNPINS